MVKVGVCYKPTLVLMLLLGGCKWLVTPTNPELANAGGGSFGGFVGGLIEKGLQPTCQRPESCDSDPDSQECRDYRQCVVDEIRNGGGSAESSGSGGSDPAAPGAACGTDVTDSPPEDEAEEKEKARCPVCGGPMKRKSRPMVVDFGANPYRMWQYQCTNRGVSRGGQFGHGDFSGRRWPLKPAE